MSISGGAETGTGMSVDSKGVVDGARLPLTLDSLAFAAPEVVRRRSLTSAHALAANSVSPPSEELRVRYRAEIHQSNPALPITIPGGPSHQALNHATALCALSAADHPVRAEAPRVSGAMRRTSYRLKAPNDPVSMDARAVGTERALAVWLRAPAARRTGADSPQSGVWGHASARDCTRFIEK